MSNHLPIYSEHEVEVNGKKFSLTKDMVNVKRYQKTLHGETFLR